MIATNGVEDNGGANPVSGMTILTAATMAEAAELAKACPHLSGTGTIEIAIAMDMEIGM